MIPLISLVIPCYKTPIYFLERLLSSIWLVKDSVEIILVDDSPYSENVSRLENHLAESFHNYTVLRNDTNIGITGSYIRGFLAANAPYSAILDHDDELNLQPVLDMISTSGNKFDFLYTDEQKFSALHTELFQKPSFDFLSAAHYFYPHHISVFRTSWVKDIISANDSFELSTTTFDICLWYEYLEKLSVKSRVGHLRKSLYGWRVHQGSTANDLNQKPRHSTERLALARRFFDNYEDNFNINPHPDIGYAVLGESKHEDKKYIDYVKSHYDIEEIRIDAQGNKKIQGQSLCRVEYLRLLRRVPLGYVHAKYPFDLLFPLENVTRSRLLIETHPDRIPYIATCSVDKVVEKDLFLSLTPRRFECNAPDAKHLHIIGWNGQ